MNSMKRIIDKNNKKIINNKREDNYKRQCNCRNKNNCPLDGKCLASGVIYQAIVKTTDAVETYIGLTDNEFKARYNNHNSSFNNITQRTATELSRYVWTLKENNSDYDIKWRIVARAKCSNNGTYKCNICTKEKFYIIFQPDMASLNNRRELVTTCRHTAKFMLNKA